MEEYYDFHLERKSIWKNLVIPARILALVVFLGIVFFHNTPELSRPAQTNLGLSSVVKTAFSFLVNSDTPLKGEDRNRINILFLGMPGQKNEAPYLTDSIMLVSIRPQEHTVGILSIPRDLLVYLPKQNVHTKINSLFIRNEKNPSLIEDKIGEVTGQKIDYYVALDMSVVENVVDTLGGLNVFVPQDIYDSSFPTDNFGTEVFEVKQGWRYFDGKTVQKYLRTRHSAGGDFARMDQQQAVIEALRKKVFGLNLLFDFPTLYSIFKDATGHIQTDITESEIKSFYDIIKDVGYDKITSRVIDATSQNALLEAGTFMFGDEKGFILKPKAGEYDYSEIQILANNIFN